MPAIALDLGPQYRALAILAKGGMGAVYLGEMRTESGDRQTVAIKVMHQHIADNAETVAMFVDEARVGTRIVHPNVVRVLATDVVQETPFLVMEYVEGLSWSRLLRRAEKEKKPIPIEIAARVIHDTLLGLGAAHELRTPAGEDARVVHRDVSPQNILVGSDGVVRITDFGVATFAGRITSTAPGELRGKLGYIAPEQLKKGGVDHRADVFAAGVVFWEALTGKRLFGADTQAETLARVLSEPIPPPSASRNEVPLDLDEVCLRALERDKERRYQHAREFASAIAGAIELADDATLVAFLNELASKDLEKQRNAREEAQRTAGRWSAPELPIAPAVNAATAAKPNPFHAVEHTERLPSSKRGAQAEQRSEPRAEPRSEARVDSAEAEASVPKSYANSVRPSSSPRLIRYAMIAGGAVLLIVVGTLIGRMSSTAPAPSGATEPAAVPTPVPVDPTPPPTASGVIAASPEPTIDLSSTPSSTNAPIRRPATKVHKPAPSASAHPPPKPTGKYVPEGL